MIVEATATAGVTAYTLMVLTTDDLLGDRALRRLMAAHALAWGVVNAALTSVAALVSPALASSITSAVILCGWYAARRVSVLYWSREIKRAKEADNAETKTKRADTSPDVAGAAGAIDGRGRGA